MVDLLYLIEILHQTTTLIPAAAILRGCILSKFYIKPQQEMYRRAAYWVVSYRNSTSNHNKVVTRPLGGRVVSYRNSTSNHNRMTRFLASYLLYLIEILHQTTTCGKCEDCLRRCILSKFYIKPQRAVPASIPTPSCILSKFYIKPQHLQPRSSRQQRCILSKFYIKPQHGARRREASRRCILSKFYIKPQLTNSN